MNEIPTLETERLVLRPFGLDDAAEVQRLAGDWDVSDTTGSVPHPYEDGVVFAITRKPDGVLVGAISLFGIAEGYRAELGYWVGKPYWNQGFCTEAGRAVLRYAFTDLGLLRVHSHYISRNPASGRVMQKLSMQHEGTLRKHARKWDKYEDLEVYGILKEEWEETAD
jgi:ribosomal-protein-alanine N-acetyltransferase